MDRFVRLINGCLFIMLIIFIPSLLIPKENIESYFIEFIGAFVAYVVGEYAMIITINDEIIERKPENKFFRIVKLSTFVRWFMYDYNKRTGMGLIIVCLQFLAFCGILLWFICFSWLVVKSFSGLFFDVVDIWKDISTGVICVFGGILAITNLFYWITQFYYAHKGDEELKEALFHNTKIDFVGEFRRKKEFKEVEWQCAIMEELRKICRKKYKGRVYVYQNDLNKLEAMISKKYPKAKMERTYDEKKKYIWRVYCEKRTLFQALIRKK